MRGKKNQTKRFPFDKWQLLDQETLKGLCSTKCMEFLQVKIRLWTTQIKGCRRTGLQVCQASQESINC